MKKFTLLFTLIGIGICLFHFIGLDTKNYVIFSLSIPLWIIAFFADVRNVSVYLIYFLTIASWSLLGYILDRLVIKSRANRL
ncbi:hypothetical protein EHS13_35925 [Paenibacillus psychroresistens]|uniref:Uncharacterized protein n=1 Tax=Paenibacillus psychroresistens TaxID=1778678 RepID=A0A6B8RXL6_9BACL|nr:hypothetical protein [Paenibacillus psychroresistens]QGQ99876.1 hypothetical protein EHS13_35925 [Paenibacillus psychroresistens]